MAGKLSVLKLTKLEPGMHSDGGGLYLNVDESGSRSWILRCTIRGKRSWLGLGSLTTVSLADARVEAVNLRARARKGEDILAERRAQKQAEKHEASIPTFEAAAIEVHGTLKPTLTNELHAYNWLHSLELHVFPVFGQKRVDTIDSSDILNALAPIWTKTPITASQILQRIKAVFDWAQAKHYRDVILNGITITKAHPCDGIRAALPKQNRLNGHHESLPYSDLPTFITKLRTSQSALSLKLAFEFLILTCARTGEVLGARWEEINFDDGVWTVPAGRMRMRREHRVPLPPRCIAILKEAKLFNDTVVFPGRYEGHGLSRMAFLMCLRRMGHGDLTAHGFRATFKTWAEERTKFDSLVIEASMAHRVRGIERHYLRSTFFDERKKLMNAWATFAT